VKGIEPAMQTDFSGKSVLVTGGTGSFGDVVVRRLLERGCPDVRVFSRDEAKQYLMRLRLGDPRVSFHLGDVRDRESVDMAMRGVDHVFHAAALKQVPNCETFPDQAVLTNVIGSQNVIRSAITHGVDRVVCLSTDKAVYPVNAMGMTKALMEKTAQAEARRAAREAKGRATVICVVRYGNVLYSRGSVVPVFVEQILSGRGTTITVPEMTRFLIRLEEAVDLVETALMYGEPGDTFVRKSPACTIGNLAEAVRRIFAADATPQVLGARPGEKMHETLATAEEMKFARELGEAWRIPLDPSDLIDPVAGNRTPYSGGDYDSANARQLNVDEIVAMLESLPEIRSALGNR
jgi:UDP-glucose 4-epimerase